MYMFVWLYMYVQGFTSLFIVVYGCASLHTVYNVVHDCTRIYMDVKSNKQHGNTLILNIEENGIKQYRL